MTTSSHVSEAESPPYGAETLPVIEERPPTRRRFTHDEYTRMADLGFFEGERVELIEGNILTMSPAGPIHSSSTSRLLQMIFRMLAPDQHLRIQDPLNAHGESSPEPDLAVVKGTPDDYAEHHPETALLVIEISKATLVYDRTTKAELYARMRIPEYLILNLLDNLLEYHSKPIADTATPGGWRYGERRVVAAGEKLTFQSLGNAEVAANDLLP